jgi:flagellar basal-body rod modification protein FlgD
MISSTQNSNPASSVYASLNAKNSSATSATGDANSAANVQDRFLKLLVTQMKNQDPLNPMDNAQVTSQMAQLSTVSGIDKLNTTLQALSTSMTSAQSLSATTMIGRSVLVPGNQMEVASGQGFGGINLTQVADSVQLTIKNSAGEVVRTMDLGAQQAGVLPLAWNGLTDSGAQAPDGNYQISAKAVLAGQSSNPAMLAFGTVNAVTQGAQGAQLEVGQLGAFSLADIKQIM